MKKKLFIAFIILLLINSSCKPGKSSDKNKSNPTFELVTPDYQTSPLTGMTRKHWKDAARYILNGAFSYVNDLDDPMKFPKQPGKSYPLKEAQIPTEKLEGLCRTLFIASPLLREDSALVLNNIKVADYYRHQLLNLIDSTKESYIAPRKKGQGPNQNLVEFGALSISLFMAPQVIWEPLPQDKKDAIAHLMLSYGDGPTVASNWKFFNIFVLSFFKDQGYSVNENLLEEYLSKTLDDYRGEGWYNDHPAYDYYSMWAYQLYGVVWNEFFGKKYYPDYAEKFKSNFIDMADNYPFLFDKDGKMIMWGRSISYRMASIAPFPFVGLIDSKKFNLGWIRHNASATILQFVQHPGFLKDSVPTLGFYGPFEPAVQNYSCRGSVYWMGKAFLGLMLPEDNPFWTEIENQGPWTNEYKNDKVYNRFSSATNTLITNYPNIGASEVRAWCHEKVADDWQKFRSTENYNRLSYNSKFLWQADSPDGAVAMNYVFLNKKEQWEALRLYTFKKFEDGFYYRDAVLETNENVKIQLSECPIPNGILRIDRYLGSDTILMRLGHYALPEKDQPIKTISRNIGGHKAIIIDNGEYQLAMVTLMGWDKLETVQIDGLNPESKSSVVINSTAKHIPNKNKTYACLMLWKKSNEDWTEKELMPVSDIISSSDGTKMNVIFTDATEKNVTF
ncbi:DUF2264 domain-containing protein [Geofilum sp. OHC36d9]|uniref:DUF2264 domain-containing protein n=1 Tax=Geofilum sp. OHC36d9 TaxID=3458413 RepID=UPI00403467F5